MNRQNDNFDPTEFDSAPQSEADIDTGWADDLDEAYQAAEKQDSFNNPPDGTYQVRVEKVRLDKHVNKDGRDIPFVAWTFEVLAGKHEGRNIYMSNFMDTESPHIELQLGFLKTALSFCGVELGKLSELPGRLKDLLDNKVEVRVKTKGQYTNVNVTRSLTGDAVTDADIPF